MLGLAGVPAVIQFIGFLFMPESPRWLVQRGEDEKAKSVLQKIRGRSDVEMELDEVRQSCDEDRRAQADSGMAQK